MTTHKHPDKEYLDLVERVLEQGVSKGDRTGTGTLSLPFQQMRFDISENKIPLLTTKKMYTRGIIHEILWYLKGDTNIKYLQENDTRIWNEWADENGDLGPVYGAMWRKWPKNGNPAIDWTTDPPSAVQSEDSVDQIARAIDLIKNNPNDRRIIVNAWNPAYLPEDGLTFSENVAKGNQALPPCHAMFQFWVNQYSKEKRFEILEQRHPDVIENGWRQKWSEDILLDTYKIPKGELRCHLYQRSCDVGLGVPFNIVQYSILTHMVAHVTGYEATEFVWTGGDVHIYYNHVEGLREQMTREPYPVPRLELSDKVSDIDGFSFDDFEIVNYECHPTISMKVSV